MALLEGETQAVLERVEGCRVRNDVDIHPEDIMCRLSPRFVLGEAITGFTVKLPVKPESTTVITKIAFDSFERRRDWGCCKFCFRPFRVNMDAEVNISRSDVWRAVCLLESVGDV
ncbi:hypothetical protein ACFQH8_21330 [Halomicroarcula sp. GCM10025710]